MVFSVRSAYKLLLDQQVLESKEPSSSEHGEAIWKALRKLQVQPKIRIFWWRVIKNFLPTSAELKRRHVSEEACYPMCGISEESLFHAFIHRDHARLFWKEAASFFDLKLPRLHPLTWKQDLLDASFVKKEYAAVAISVMWAIWKNRNKYSHGEDHYQPQKSMELIHELITSLNIPSQDPGGKVKVKQKWTAPATGWIKLNCDGALDPATGDAGAGVVARDEQGAFLFTRCSKYPAKEDHFIVEALACRDHGDRLPGHLHHVVSGR